ncbi:PaaI family thioesterase [Mesorhizobium sp. YIM 152430]|uniref:PaaI family thioesterase n=1 Tax=Mesorhizobium sp. YIM 152430 TaxID=3031761 RepID=UPI0023DA5080|nr:PaaI family thioesterase [Mesorhizobium sp. YIM 152430]MDF1600499.1 PaaI family thioesterase [Mesorhizobium sp. YIM 152430]
MTAVEIFPGHVVPRGLGTIPHADVEIYSGLELLRRVVSGEYPAPSIAARINFALVEVGEGRAVFKGMPGARHFNPLGSVHGGWAATVLDSALGCSIHTLLAKGEGYSTVEMKVNYLRPISEKTGVVTCEGKVVSKGRTLAVSEARLTDANGKLLAIGTETCAIFPIANLAAR